MTIKNGHIYFKYGVILIIAILVFLFFRGCGGKTKEVTKVVTKDSVVTVEKIVFDTVYTPVPQKVIVKNVVYKTDTLETFEYIPADTATILMDYTARRLYSDTIRNRYGYVVVSDTVMHNRIKGRKTFTRIEVPTTTITKTEEKPNRSFLYVGADLIGSENNIFTASGPVLGIQARNRKSYEAGVLINREGELQYRFGFRVPISFRKK